METKIGTKYEKSKIQEGTQHSISQPEVLGLSGVTRDPSVYPTDLILG